MLIRLRTILILAIAMTATSSCLSSVSTEASRTVEFIPMIAGAVRSGNMETKATEAFDEFGVYAFKEDGSLFMDRERVAFDGNAWTSDERFAWADDSMLRFFAYTPYAKGLEEILGSGSLKLDHYDVTSATAPVCFSRITTLLDKNSGPVVVLFDPATALIDFRVINGLGEGSEIKIEKIILQNIHVSGSFDSSNSPQWTLAQESEDFTAYKGSDEIIAPKATMSIGKPVNMIPQSPTSGIKVVFSHRTAGSQWLTGQEAYTEDLTASWEEGRRYTYTLTITGAHTVKYTMGVGNWEGRQ